MSLWRAHVRVERDGRFAEYDDKIEIFEPQGAPTSARDVVECVLQMIAESDPSMKSGRLTVCRVKKIS